ncbi:hypothetical protein [Pseudomonas sp. RT6P73]
MRTLIVLVGVQGAGKTTLLNDLEFGTVLKPSTSRKPRNNNDKEYHFENVPWVDSDFAWTISYKGCSYGMRLSELDAIQDVGITVFQPSSLASLRASAACDNFEVVTVGLDTISSLAEQKRRVGGGQTV